jgi:hypothetical protein
MKNYRVWEANRKVFLYPENYIRPELRDTKTPAFKILEEALLQGEINRELVEKSYNEYLDEFAIVGNLKITGANVYNDVDDKVLIVFGHTHTDPIQYYYRTAKFKKSGTVIWENWEKVNISINSTRVFPVHAFGRIMVFWIEIEAFEDANAVVAFNNDSSSSIDISDKKLSQKANIKYSFYNYSKQWINPQDLKDDIDLEYTIDAAFSENDQIIAFSGKFVLQSSASNPSGDVKTIQEVYPGLPANFHTGIDAAARFGSNRYFFKDGQCVVNSGAAVPIKDIFQTFDLPDVYHPFFFPPVLIPNNFLLTEFRNGVAATFALDNIMCLIDKKGGYNFFSHDPSTGKFTIILNQLDLHAFWNPFIRMITNNLRTLNPVDAVFEDENKVLYVLRKGQYECYTFESGVIKTLKPLEGFPKPIKGNLSFNMDKFFNKLHVADFIEAGEEFVSLTYTTPKETILLSGQIKPDLTFQEAELRSDYQKNLILDWEKNYFTFQNIKYDKNKNAAARKAFEDTNTSIDTIIKRANHLTDFGESLTILKSELNKANPVKRVFNDALDNTLDKIKITTPSLQGAAFRKKVKTLKTNIEELKAFFNTNPTNAADKKKLAKMKLEVSEMTTEIKRDIADDQFSIIKKAISDLKTSLENNQASRLQSISDNRLSHENNLNLYDKIAVFAKNTLEKDDTTVAAFNSAIESYKTKLQTRLDEIDKKAVAIIGQAANATTNATQIQVLKSAISTNNSAITK